jgi:hypothetical protein
MMTGLASQFEKQLMQRGYTLAEVEPCIAARNGDQITVDETHPAYPHAREGEIAEPAIESGPGTVLKGWLGWFGITATNDCACDSRAAKMDQLGSEWVRQNLDVVVGWLEEAAKARGGIVWMAFSRTATRMLVLRACDSADAQAGLRVT